MAGWLAGWLAGKKMHTTILTITPLSLTVGLDPGARFSLGWLGGGGRDTPTGWLLTTPTLLAAENEPASDVGSLLPTASE